MIKQTCFRCKKPCQGYLCRECDSHKGTDVSARRRGVKRRNEQSRTEMG